jgi:hypothetical protein
MKLFTSKIPENSLHARLDNKDVSAAREVLEKFCNNIPTDRDRLLQALTVLILDLDRAGHA